MKRECHRNGGHFTSDLKLIEKRSNNDKYRIYCCNLPWFLNHNLFNPEDWLKFTHRVKTIENAHFDVKWLYIFCCLFVWIEYNLANEFTDLSSNLTCTIELTFEIERSFMWNALNRYKSWMTIPQKVYPLKMIKIETVWMYFGKILWLFAKENTFLCNKMICDRSLNRNDPTNRLQLNCFIAVYILFRCKMASLCDDQIKRKIGRERRALSPEKKRKENRNRFLELIDKAAFSHRPWNAR